MWFASCASSCSRRRFAVNEASTAKCWNGNAKRCNVAESLVLSCIVLQCCSIQDTHNPLVEGSSPSRPTKKQGVARLAVPFYSRLVNKLSTDLSCQFVDALKHCQWVERFCFLQMVWRKMCIAHRHGQAAVTKNFLQHQDIPAIHHKVTGEGMSQYMRELPFRQC